MLRQLDRLAGWWLDRRTDCLVEEDDDLSVFQIESFSHEEGVTMITATAPNVAILAAECASLLEAFEAENYVEFSLLPRVDRQLKPVLVTVQWVSGMSPSEKAAKLEGYLWDCYGLLRNWPNGRPGKESARELVGRVVDFLEGDGGET